MPLANRVQVASDAFTSSISGTLWTNPDASPHEPLQWVSSGEVTLSSTGVDNAFIKRTASGETYPTAQYSTVVVNFQHTDASGASTDMFAAAYLPAGGTKGGYAGVSSANPDDVKYSIYRVESDGTTTTLTSSGTGAPLAFGDTITLEVDGTGIRLYTNESGGGDTLRLSTTDGTYTSGKPGFGGYTRSVGSTTDAQFHSWSGGSLASNTLTGVVGTGAVGSLAQARTLALTGNAATGNVGTVTPTTGTVISLSGVVATSAVGNVSAGVVNGLLQLGFVPQSGPGPRGPFNNSQFRRSPQAFLAGPTVLNLALSGVQGTGAVGNITQGISIALTGVAGTGAVGTVNATTGLVLTLTGVSGTSATGILAPSSNVSITGNGASTAVGTIIAGSGLIVTLTGNSATGSVGLVVPNRALQSSGNQASGLTGVITASGGTPTGLTNNGTYRMIKVFVVSSTGRVRWVSYVPMKQFASTTPAQADRFDDNGALTIKVLSDVTGLTEWVDYLPVVMVADANTGKWRYDDTGFIPVVPVV